MEIINFEEAKERRGLKGKAGNYLRKADNDILKLQKQYQAFARFCNRWYDEHVIGQDENGGWIYKD